ncbi:TetR/AcrR family transcriptional regulator [Paractinoplanes toevensis]|uniref:TetR family transcriptional regulator n=1 Tax=Paractinoplanes toevensis TaxID=571911 RepID=A0A919W8S7_9ACTN|nr:TetR/AcrR family transcriptional regulator [Actinoplanes toevensis]GIM95421.1 TetR family transcriptional regulator [Actinoplanes toevensis]
MTPRPEPVSRRDRPAKPPLSRAGIVEVGLRIMRAEGLEKATMRRLAAELDTGPASLYVYVENMAELHGALLDELLAGLDLELELIDLLVGYTELLLGQPALARSVLTLRPAGPRYLRLIDVVLGRLHDLGVPPRAAAWGVDLLLQQATAAAAEHGAGDDDRGQVAAVRDADPAGYPHIHTVRDELFSGTGEERLRWGFAALLDGLRQR